MQNSDRFQKLLLIFNNIYLFYYYIVTRELKMCVVIGSFYLYNP